MARAVAGVSRRSAEVASTAVAAQLASVKAAQAEAGSRRSAMAREVAGAVVPLPSAMAREARGAAVSHASGRVLGAVTAAVGARWSAMVRADRVAGMPGDFPSAVRVQPAGANPSPPP